MAGETSEFGGRVAIVTGAGAGIGRAVALRLVAEGCAVGLIDVDAAGLAATADAVHALGGSVAVATADVADRAAVVAAIDTLVAAHGAVNILVNNAGILRTAPFLDTSHDDWRASFAVNLDGVFHCCQVVLPAMVARRNGTIVNMASWTGKQGVANHAAYGATKAAIINLTQSLAAEFGAHGIRVNAVCPGIIANTPMRVAAEARARAQGLPDVDTRTRTIPLRRAGSPAEVAELVAFLASDRAAYMTGQAVNVTGGLWMG